MRRLVDVTHLDQQLAQRRDLLVIGYLSYRFDQRVGILRGFERVACNYDDIVGIRNPHIADMLVLAEQAGVMRLDIAARHDGRPLDQLVRGDALKRGFRNHAQAAKPHPREMEQLRVALSRKNQRAACRGHKLEGYHALIHWGQRRARAVGPDLDETADLLLSN
jgi:hypothetical protein